MSESTAPTVDPTQRKSKAFGRQLSKTFEKSFQKGKEAMKRGLLTPRGARAQQKPTAEAPEYKAQVASAVPNIPKSSVPAQDPIHKAGDKGVASDSANEVAAVKATIQAKEDSAAPGVVVLEPVEDAGSHEVTGPATPVPTIKPLPVAEHTAELSEPQKTAAPAALHTTEKAEPPVEEGSGAPEEELGFAPPNVTVTVTGTPTNESKAVVAAEAKEATPHGKMVQKKADTGGMKKALVGILILAAASAAGLAVRGGHTH